VDSTNNPPGPIEYAQSVIDEVAAWLANHPVIQTEEEARGAKVYIDRGVAALAEIEIQRVKLVAPLNEQVAAINGEHKRYHNTDKAKPGLFDKVLNALKGRVQAFMLAEEARRKKDAEDARLLAEAAEKAAREAEAREKEVHDDASQGILGLDVQEATRDADAAFADFQKASRFAALAERETKVKVGGGFGKSLSIRKREVLVVKDWHKAIVSVGLTEGIADAILTAARNYRNEYGELPPGIESTQERTL
jgi:hypothetical protein